VRTREEATLVTSVDGDEADEADEDDEERRGEDIKEAEDGAPCSSSSSLIHLHA
jgi:hypothetical protein